MLLDLAWLALGALGLYFGAEWLVRGAAGLARSFGVSSLVVGLTVVAYGTSMPELVVGCSAAWEGKSAIALGNAVGSNIANVGLILGITALISPPAVERGLIFRELPALLLATVAIPVMLLDGRIGRVDASLLLLGAVAFTSFLVIASRRESRRFARIPEPEEHDEHEHHETRARLVGWAVLGMAVLVLGGNVFVDGAVGLALKVGMSERVVGLTIVAVGTSLPELAASLVAALRGHSALAVGNVVGSNIFNMLLILGGAGMIAPIEGSLGAMRLDFTVLVFVTVLAIVSLRTERVITRFEGALLVAVYVGFLAALAAGVA